MQSGGSEIFPRLMKMTFDGSRGFWEVFFDRVLCETWNTKEIVMLDSFDES